MVENRDANMAAITGRLVYLFIYVIFFFKTKSSSDLKNRAS